MRLDFNYIDNIIDFLKELQVYLIPFAIFFFAIYIIHGLYVFFYHRDEEDSVAFNKYVLRLFIKGGVGLIIFAIFPYVCDLPGKFIDRTYEQLGKLNPANKILSKEIKKGEDFLQKKGLLNKINTNDNTGIKYKEWQKVNPLAKIRIINMYQEYYDGLDKKGGVENPINGFDSWISNLKKKQLALEAVENMKNKDNEISFWDILTDLNFLDMMQLLLNVVANWVLGLVRQLILYIFRLLFYLDLLLGLFVAVVAILPGMSNNITRWLKDHVSLLLWGLIFIMIEWLLAIFSAMVVIGEGSDNWVMPIISILVYGTVAYQAGRILGTGEAGGGILPRMSSFALNSIPLLVGGGMAFAKNLSKAPVGKDVGNIISKIPGAKPVNQAIKNTINYFTPQKN